MPTHRITPLGALRTAICALVLLLPVVSVQIAHAAVLRIDAAASTVTHTAASSEICYWDFQLGLVCTPPAPPGVFTIAGDIDVELIDQHLDFGFGFPPVDRTLLQLRTSNLISGALAQGFHLPGGLGRMIGEAFEVSDDPCFLFVGPGSCSGWVAGTRTGSAGNWNGATLVWSGYQKSSVDEFTFSITARAVPEPGTLSLTLVMLAIVSLAGRRGVRRFPQAAAPGILA